MGPIKIRDYTIDDLDKCREILFNIQMNDFNWVNHSKLQLDDFDHITEGEKIFVVCINQEVVSFASVWEEDYFLHSLYISRQFRRYGIGRRLISFLSDYYKHPLTLKCVKENTEALSFYLSVGWVIYKEEIGIDGPYYLLGSQPK